MSTLPSDKKLGWIIGLFLAVSVLEFATPPDYVLGYLYIGPILIATSRLNPPATLLLTLTACSLILMNIWIPGLVRADLATIVSRSAAALAILVTSGLGHRNHRYQQELLAQQAQIQSQARLTQERENFASTLAHDLKTPLLGAIETLKSWRRGNFGPVSSSQKAVLATIINSHRTTLQLVETMLEVYKNDIEGLKLNLGPVNLVDLVEEVTAILVELAASRRVHISHNHGPSDFRQFLWVRGDALQLQRVVANLLINGINHSPRGARVEVSFEAGSSRHLVKVADQGPGLSPAQQDQVFEQFYQGHSDRRAKGSGLGLYLSRQIIQAHQGSIWAESRQPNGAVFGFSLPALAFRPPK